MNTPSEQLGEMPGCKPKACKPKSQNAARGLESLRLYNCERLSICRKSSGQGLSVGNIL